MKVQRHDFIERGVYNDASEKAFTAALGDLQRSMAAVAIAAMPLLCKVEYLFDAAKTRCAQPDAMQFLFPHPRYAAHFLHNSQYTLKFVRLTCTLAEPIDSPYTCICWLIVLCEMS
jgi:hypothetical protein